jgi:cardiolipin synthase
VRIELLVDSGEFWLRLCEDLEAARRYVYLQTFSFEGDRVGSSMGRRLEACQAEDRRFLVDGYSLLSQNDRIIYGPAWLERPFRREFFLTHRWVKRLRSRGVGVRFGKPVGPSPVLLIRRSHKKLAVFDDRVAYLGGINFCDHNFEWHDMMLRIEDPGLAKHLADDFRANWDGEAVASDESFGPLRVISLNGRDNPTGFGPVIGAIEAAQRSIDVVSAYLSPPFTDHLAAASARGVRIRILTPALNNKPNLAYHAYEAARRHGFQILHYPDRMNHMKAMMIDDELLIAGSSNFDSMGYHILEELFLMTRDPRVVGAFKGRVWDPDVAASPSVEPRSTWRTRFGHRSIRVGAALARVFALG